MWRECHKMREQELFQDFLNENYKDLLQMVYRVEHHLGPYLELQSLLGDPQITNGNDLSNVRNALLSNLDDELQIIPKLDFIVKQRGNILTFNSLNLNEAYCVFLDSSEYNDCFSSASSRSSRESSDDKEEHKPIKAKKKIKRQATKHVSSESEGDSKSDTDEVPMNDNMFIVYERNKRHTFAYEFYRYRSVSLDIDFTKEEETSIDKQRLEAKERRVHLEEMLQIGSSSEQREIQTSECEDLRFLSDTLSDSA